MSSSERGDVVKRTPLRGIASYPIPDACYGVRTMQRKRRDQTLLRYSASRSPDLSRASDSQIARKTREGQEILESPPQALRSRETG